MNVLLVVSFGTTVPGSRELNIGAVEETIREAAPDDYEIRRCFTSKMVVSIIEKREGIHIDDVESALRRAIDDGAVNLVLQPTHLMKGLEYDKLCRILSEYADSFDRITIGDPLLAADEDCGRVAEALIDATAEYDDVNTAIVFMGHGTDAGSNRVYTMLQEVLTGKGRSNYFIGTVEAAPSLDDVIAAVRAGSYSRVVLRPLMLVAGNHAVNDMASPDDPGSWYSRFAALGYETKCIISGLGEIPAVRNIYAEHALDAMRG